MSNLLLKELLEDECEIEDLKEFDNAAYNSMKYLNENDDLIDSLYLTLSVLDEGIEKELVPDGQLIFVTKHNK